MSPRPAERAGEINLHGRLVIDREEYLAICNVDPDIMIGAIRQIDACAGYGRGAATLRIGGE